MSSGQARWLFPHPSAFTAISTLTCQIIATLCAIDREVCGRSSREDAKNSFIRHVRPLPTCFLCLQSRAQVHSHQLERAGESARNHHGKCLRKSIHGSAVVLRSPLGRRGEGNRRHHRVTVRVQGSPGAWNAVCHPCQPRLLGKESLNGAGHFSLETRAIPKGSEIVTSREKGNKE